MRDGLSPAVTRPPRLSVFLPPRRVVVQPDARPVRRGVAIAWARSSEGKPRPQPDRVDEDEPGDETDAVVDHRRAPERAIMLASDPRYEATTSGWRMTSAGVP